MIGRKRSEQARAIAARGSSRGALGIDREIDHHDGVLLDDADQQQNAEKRDQAELVPVAISASSAPTPADGSVERIVSGWL
jgi:hypothetical protein